MYALMFSVLYMGMSAMEAGSNFSNTALFGFLDTFCFPPETKVTVQGKDQVPIHAVRIGDVLVSPESPKGSRVTSKFLFAARGQPMVRLGDIVVSTNHYLFYEGKWVQAGDHPEAVPIGPYERETLVCLNTEDHVIPMGPYQFRDYDETDAAHEPTMRMIEGRINSIVPTKHTPYPFRENSPCLHPDTLLRLKGAALSPLRDIRLGDTLATGATVVGIVHKEVKEVCWVGPNRMGSATLVWRPERQQWVRAGEFRPVQTLETPVVFIGLFVLSNSQIELANGIRIRDYMELCSPDSECFYEQMLSC
jgi:hypothetical protein